MTSRSQSVMNLVLSQKKKVSFVAEVWLWTENLHFSRCVAWSFSKVPPFWLQTEMGRKIHAKKKRSKIWATEVLSRSIKMRACSFLTAKMIYERKKNAIHTPFRKSNRWSTILGQQNFLAEISPSLKSSSITVWVENHLGYFAPILRTRINCKCQLLLQFAWSLFSSFLEAIIEGSAPQNAKQNWNLLLSWPQTIRSMQARDYVTWQICTWKFLISLKNKKA